MKSYEDYNNFCKEHGLSPCRYESMEAYNNSKQRENLNNGKQ